MNQREYISKGVTTRSNFFDGTVQEQGDLEIDEQITQGSVTARDQALGPHERDVDAAAQCDIGRTEEDEILSLPTFIYPEFMSWPGNIRLITLQPALYFWSPIRCSLFHTLIANKDHLEYKALSYTWKKDAIYDEDTLRTLIQKLGCQTFPYHLDVDGKSSGGELYAITLNGHILHIGENLMDVLQRLRHKTEPQI